ncbi:MAG TPA: site-specific integrase [Clostridia bacterium]|nr:site-specific integrase [Clostridia bacterium]
MRRARYQYGTVELSPRSQGPAVWVYRWREPGPQGKSIRRTLVLGTTEKIKTKAQALKAAEGCRLKVNDDYATTRVITFGALIDRFILEEHLHEAKDRNRSVGLVAEDEAFNYELLEPSTASSYLSMIKVHIRPRWEKVPLEDVKPGKVETRLKSIDREPKTKGHLKELMHRLFEKAMLWELLPIDRNPMELVTVKGISKRAKKPTVLTVEQCLIIISLLPEPYRTMVMVAICTGLRVSEILALRWSRIDFENLTVTVRVKVVNGRVGRVKTEYSEDELPLDPEFAAVLLNWKSRCPKSPGDWVFPSPFTDRCYHAGPIQQDYIRPAGKKAGGVSVGWHTFRHTYRTWLDATGAPVGVQQKLLRHADIGTTMKYGNALMESKRDANSKVVRMARPLLQQAHA